MLCDCAGVDPACAREADAALCQFLARELVGAGADGLDEAEPLRMFKQVVVPQA